LNHGFDTGFRGSRKESLGIEFAYRVTKRVIGGFDRTLPTRTQLRDAFDRRAMECEVLGDNRLRQERRAMLYGV
jgi:hypothetical protein